MEDQTIAELARDQKIDQFRRVTKDRLLQYCEDHKIKADKSMSKIEIISLIQMTLEPTRQIHVTRFKNLKINRDREYEQSLGPKPNGFWFAPGDEWLTFVNEGGLAYKYGKHPKSYRVIVFRKNYTDVQRKRKSSSPKKIFVVGSLKDLKYIEDEYAVTDMSQLYWDYHRENIEDRGETPDQLTELFNKMRVDQQKSLFEIDWIKFSERYGGIEIRNYDESLRIGHGWYSTFDVSSTCVWDLDLVENLWNV